MPFDLGVVGDELPPSERDGPAGPGRAVGRWVWAFVALAFVVGGVSGLVVADARDDAAGFADVRLVTGVIQGSSVQPDETVPGYVEVSVLNLGEHEVEILDLRPARMTIRPDQEPGEPVVVPPGEWETVRQAGLVADCASDDPCDVVSLRVRDGAGTERVVEADGIPDLTGVNQAWWTACQPQLFFGQGNPFASEHDGDTLTMELRLENYGGRPLQVVTFEPEAPGLAMTVPEMPFEVPAGATLDIPLTWTVTDCTLARDWQDVWIDYQVGADGSTMSGGQVLEGGHRAELVRLVDRVCESGS